MWPNDTYGQPPLVTHMNMDSAFSMDVLRETSAGCAGTLLGVDPVDGAVSLDIGNHLFHQPVSVLQGLSGTF